MAANVPQRRRSPVGLRGGFTLVELVVVLTVVVVLAGIAIPSFLGLRDESLAREPVDALEALVADVRERAESEGRAYEIVFDRDGFFAMPRGGLAEGREALRERYTTLADPPDRTEIDRQLIERAEVVSESPVVRERASAVAAELEREGDGILSGYVPPFLGGYATGEALELELLFWGDPDWQVVENEAVRRWVFQPGALVQPLRVRFSAERAFFEVGFDPLTAETIGERSSVGGGGA